MNGSTIDLILVSLIKLINGAIDSTRQAVVNTINTNDYDKHDELYERLKKLSLFLSKSEELRCEWEKLQLNIVEFDLSEPKSEQILEPEPPPATPKSLPNRYSGTKSSYKLKVTFSDGSIIQEYKAADTLIKFIEKIGVDRVYALKLGLRGGSSYPLVSFSPVEDQSPHPSGKYFIHTHCSNDDKVRRIKEISSRLGLHIKVERLP